MDNNMEQEKQMEFKAKYVDGNLVIEPIVITDENGNVTVHVPSLELINKFNNENK